MHHGASDAQSEVVAVISSSMFLCWFLPHSTRTHVLTHTHTATHTHTHTLTQTHTHTHTHTHTDKITYADRITYTQTHTHTGMANNPCIFHIRRDLCF